MLCTPSLLHPRWLIAGDRRSTRPHAPVRSRQRRRLIGKKLNDGEVAGGSVTPDMFPNPFCIYGCPWLAQRLTGASSTVAIAGGGATLRQARRLRRWQAKASTAMSSEIPSEDLGLGEGNGGAAVKLGRVHGITVARAWW